MQRQSRAHNILAGSFLLTALLVAVVLAFVFSGYSFERTDRYFVRFGLGVGAAGLQPGSMVTLGGRPIGQVASLDFGSTRPDGAPDHVMVAVDVRADLVLYDNAQTYLVRPLLGTISTINLASPGSDQGGQRLSEGGVLEGRLAPPGFLAEAGFGPEQQDQVQTILAQLEEGSARLNAVLAPFDDRSERLASLAENSLTNLSDASYNLRIRLDEWSRALDNVVANIEWFSGELQPLVLDAREGVEEAGLLFRRGNGFLDENREGLEASIASLRTALEQIETETVPQFTQLGEDARAQVADLRETIGEADRFLRAEVEPNLRRALANAAVASGFLKHAIAEIRDQPWRLLVRPTKRELSEQLVYDAARTYAAAVGELRSASEALAVSAGTRQTDTEQLRRMSEHLEEAFERYREAERALLQRMTRTAD